MQVQRLLGELEGGRRGLDAALASLPADNKAARQVLLAASARLAASHDREVELAEVQADIGAAAAALLAQLAASAPSQEAGGSATRAAVDAMHQLRLASELGAEAGRAAPDGQTAPDGGVLDASLSELAKVLPVELVQEFRGVMESLYARARELRAQVSEDAAWAVPPRYAPFHICHPPPPHSLCAWSWIAQVPWAAYWCLLLPVLSVSYVVAWRAERDAPLPPFTTLGAPTAPLPPGLSCRQRSATLRQR